MDVDRSVDSAQKISMVIDALRAGTLKIRRQDEPWARELLALPRGPTGLLDISKLSRKALAMARATALALRGLSQGFEEKPPEPNLSLLDSQCALFRHYEALFLALTGTNSENVASPEEIKSRLLERVRHFSDDLADDFNTAAGELEQFYLENSTALFRIAQSIGGVKVVLGGQRQFGPSALAATRIAGLYCDTQLIPDPVYPFLMGGDLHLNALHLQLAIVLFHILPLRPLADARLPEPPILVFPSFEEALEERDAITQAGLGSLIVKVVAPALNAKIGTIDEMFEYAAKYEQEFLYGITKERLFIPPGVAADKVGSASEAAEIYLRDLKGIRDQRILDEMHRLPRGVLVLNGILERLRPQYHLMENAEELHAQPLLSQPAHWYYFERCSLAETRALVNERILRPEAFDILRALQDDSLTWLANIPVQGLAEIRERLEHADLREQLGKITAQLTAAGPAELDAVVREVRHALEVLIQRQQKAIKDIEDKYAPKRWVTGTGSVIGALAGASMHFMPSLAALAGVTAPVASVLGAMGAGGAAAAAGGIGQLVEKRMARKTMLGMLAAARAKSN
jgi:hypothetical protein